MKFDVNAMACQLCDDAMQQAERLGITAYQRGEVRVLDFGTHRMGTIEGGIMLSRICLADLADVDVLFSGAIGMPMVQVTTDHPLAACIASQYAGWPFEREGFFAMASGPARTLRGKEELLRDYGLEGASDTSVVVFETEQEIGQDVAHQLLDECGTDSGTICVAKTSSLPGTIQVVARSIETALHKLHEIGFDLRQVQRGMGQAPLPPLAKDSLTSLGWTNDAILYGGNVWLWVDTEDGELEKLGPSIPSSSSESFGKPFLQLFQEAGHDFYKMDKMLFSPARISLNNIRSGNTFTFGQIRPDILHSSFGMLDQG